MGCKSIPATLFLLPSFLAPFVAFIGPKELLLALGRKRAGIFWVEVAQTAATGFHARAHSHGTGRKSFTTVFLRASRILSHGYFRRRDAGGPANLMNEIWTSSRTVQVQRHTFAHRRTSPISLSFVLRFILEHRGHGVEETRRDLAREFYLFLYQRSIRVLVGWKKNRWSCGYFFALRFLCLSRRKSRKERKLGKILFGMNKYQKFSYLLVPLFNFFFISREKNFWALFFLLLSRKKIEKYKKERQWGKILFGNNRYQKFFYLVVSMFNFFFISRKENWSSVTIFLNFVLSSVFEKKIEKFKEERQ